MAVIGKIQIFPKGDIHLRFGHLPAVLRRFAASVPMELKRCDKCRVGVYVAESDTFVCERCSPPIKEGADG